MMSRLVTTLINTIPILIMIGLIPLVPNDYVLALLYIFIIAVALFIKRDRKDIIVLVAGALLLTISESIFVSTGVETFVRHSLFSLMPLWLPLLWGYAFVVIKRIVLVI